MSEVNRAEAQRVSDYYRPTDRDVSDTIDALLAALTEAEARAETLGLAFEDNFPLSVEEWCDVRNAWQRRLGRAEAESARLREERDAAVEVIEFYADPDSYNAIAFFFDSPCGRFADDFSEDHGDEFYDRAMPGKLARAFLATLTSEETQ